MEEGPMSALRNLCAVVTVAVTICLSAGVGAAPLYYLTDLGALGGSASAAYDINELGQIVGTYTNSAGQTEAFRTAPNSPINPVTDRLGFLPGGTESVATGIND